MNGQFNSDCQSITGNQEEHAMPIQEMARIILDEMETATSRLNSDKLLARLLPVADRLEAGVEPVIAYVKAESEGKEQHYLITRHCAFAEAERSDVFFVTYRSPVGSIAAYSPGEQLRVKLPEKKFKELKILETDRFLPAHDGQVWDATRNSVLLPDKRYSIPSLREFLLQIDGYQPESGLVKPDLVKVSLRDQFILDKVQDEVFRLPIGRSIVLTGTAGTGKTTVLVKRIGLKRELSFKTEDEEKISPQVLDTVYGLPSDRRWILFTPTTDLMVYLKEALSKEQIAAPEEMIKTWENCALALARDFGVVHLKKLRLAKSNNILLEQTSPALTAFTDELRARFRDRLNGLPLRLGEWMKEDKRSESYSVELVDHFITQMKTYVSRGQRFNDQSLYTTIRGLLHFYQDFLQSSKAEAFKNTDFKPLVPLAKELWQAKGPVTMDAFKNLLIDSYPSIRRSINKDGITRFSIPEDSNLISPLELDSILCLILEIAAAHMADKAPFDRERDAYTSVYRQSLRTAVYVDEAPDFSAIQLRCMSLLAHPLLPSIVVSGDLMQKLSICGIQRWEECEWAFGSREHYDLTTVYRHSSTLFEMARTLYGKSQHVSNGYDRSTADIRPVAKCYSDDNDLGSWLLSSIREAAARFPRMPSMAIFVETEDDLPRVNALIADELYGDGIKVEMCREGRIASADNVKIMTINYIKGLEFECVFIIDIDLISTRFAGFETKVLYLGATRAASVLGMAYSIEYPPALEPVRKFFDFV